jgi:phosphoribosylanthranilate isomerase
VARVKTKICCISSIEEARLAIQYGADALGLVGHMPSGPGVIEDDSAIDLVTMYEPRVHAFLLDSGRPSAAVAELGGTGRAHDWRISASIVRATTRPVYLAGGLTSENVSQAIDRVNPFGLDLCSGVRTGNALDESKLKVFMETVEKF